MLGPTTWTFYCACLTRPPDFLSRFRNVAGATQRIRIDKIESQVAPSEEAVGEQFSDKTHRINAFTIFNSLECNMDCLRPSGNFINMHKIGKIASAGFNSHLLANTWRNWNSKYQKCKIQLNSDI